MCVCVHDGSILDLELNQDGSPPSLFLILIPLISAKWIMEIYR
jgi:hypothetical protein